MILEDAFRKANLTEALAIAKQVKATAFCPKHYKNCQPMDIVIGVNHGMSLGLNLLESLKGIVPYEGESFTINSDSAKLLVFRMYPEVHFNVSHTGTLEKKDYTITIKSKQTTSGKTVKTTYSYMDAVRNGLIHDKLKDDSFYVTHADRMILHRAFGYHIGDFYGECTGGLKTTEEMPVKITHLDAEGKIVTSGESLKSKTASKTSNTAKVAQKRSNLPKTNNQFGLVSMPLDSDGKRGPKLVSMMEDSWDRAGLYDIEVVQALKNASLDEMFPNRNSLLTKGSYQEINLVLAAAKARF